MARRQKNPGIALSSLQEALQTLPIREAVGRSDKRSLSKARALFGELSGVKPSTAAQVLGISTQKFIQLREQTKAGKIASPVLNDLLQQAAGQIGESREKLAEIETYPHSEAGTYISDQPVNGKRKFKIDYVVTSRDFVHDNMKFATSVKPGGFASLQSALNWYGGVTGGKEYFWIVRDKNTGKYLIYDVRTSRERSKHNKGKISGQTKAMQIMDEFEPTWRDTFETQTKEKNKNGRGRKGKTSTGGRGAKTRRTVATGKGKKSARTRKAR